MIPYYHKLVSIMVMASTVQCCGSGRSLYRHSKTHPNLSQEIDVDQVLYKLIRFGIDVHMGQYDARVVHHYVHGAQFFHDHRVHAADLLPIGNVDFVTFGYSAVSIDCFCRLAAPFAVDVNASNFSAQHVEPLAKFAAQTSRGPGNL